MQRRSVQLRTIAALERLFTVTNCRSASVHYADRISSINCSTASSLDWVTFSLCKALPVVSVNPFFAIFTTSLKNTLSFKFPFSHRLGDPSTMEIKRPRCFECEKQGIRQALRFSICEYRYNYLLPRPLMHRGSYVESWWWPDIESRQISYYFAHCKECRKANGNVRRHQHVEAFQRQHLEIIILILKKPMMDPKEHEIRWG